jgi:DNA-binding LytR/AlgR family response regulator
MKNQISFIAVDDSFLDLLAVQEFAKNNTNLLNLGVYSNATDALLAINDLKPNLVFLDIEMPEFTGLELLSVVRKSVPMAVFITSHPEFAIDGFDLSALDYILKPLTQERFNICIKRVEEYWEMKNKAALYEIAFEQDTLTIKDGHNRMQIKRSDIIYVEAMQDYTKIVTATKNYLTLSTLTQFVGQFTDNELLRVHRSYAVAIKKITELRVNELFCNHYLIPIGKTYKPVVAQLRL